MKQISLNTIPEQGVSHNAAIRKQVMLQSGDLPHLAQLTQARFEPGQAAAAYAHVDINEVFFVQSGYGAMTVDNEVYSLAPGVCIAVAPGEAHEVRNSSNERLVLTYFGIIQSGGKP